ncbi:hypothetical protein O6P43_028014 [Quillaja saponaria]|uniref:Uncharacterized protein n=1 Tax=Quillaja saponaria TaxID=32244 RepID=A0AAD7PEM4_QUISA|nr:hypothetical protein O6P43_028014 [Quillaja saponaria]
MCQQGCASPNQKKEKKRIIVLYFDLFAVCRPYTDPTQNMFVYDFVHEYTRKIGIKFFYTFYSLGSI